MNIEEFNQKFKSGDKIQLLDDFGNPFEAIVTHGAHMLSGHTPVVYIKSSKANGAYDLERLAKEE